MPRITANASPKPTRLMPRPQSVDPMPQAKPKSATFSSVGQEAPEYTLPRCGMVAQAMSHGKITKPVIAKTSQEFSQRHDDIFFIGAAKLPFKTPARSTIVM